MYKVYHIFPKNKGQLPIMLNEGLFNHKEFIPFFANDFVVLGKTIQKKEEDFEKILDNCDFIFMYDREVIKKEDNLLCILNLINKKNLWNKVIYFHQTRYAEPREDIYKKCFAYFKTIWREKFINRDYPIFPFPYGILDATLNIKLEKHHRNIDILCTLTRGQTLYNTKRINVLNSLKEEDWEGFVVGLRKIFICKRHGRNAPWYDPKTEGKGWVKYIHLMNSSKIIFTARPSDPKNIGNWGGEDYRSWEALSSGALIFMDHPNTPSQNYFEHGKHCFFFDGLNKKSIKKSINMAKDLLHGKGEDKRRKIALNGYNHAIKYHNSKARINFILKAIKSVENNTYKHLINSILDEFEKLKAKNKSKM